MMSSENENPEPQSNTEEPTNGKSQQATQKKLFKKLGQFFSRFKVLTGEEAFFCFAADEEFYQELKREKEKPGYDVSSSWFRQEIFVAFSPSEFHEYIEKRIYFDEDSPWPNQLKKELSEKFEKSSAGLAREIRAKDLAKESEDKQVMEESKLDGNANKSELDRVKLKRKFITSGFEGLGRELGLDLAVLKYVILFRSGMRMLDVQRQILHMTHFFESANQNPGKYYSYNRYKEELCIQIAIEHVLNEDSIQTFIDSDPSQMQRIYNLLYEVVRRLQNGAKSEELTLEKILAATEGVGNQTANGVTTS